MLFPNLQYIAKDKQKQTAKCCPFLLIITVFQGYP
jgi:hypothetical protein